LKSDVTNSDIILLQQVTGELLTELNKKLGDKYIIIPGEFPLEVKSISVICLLKSTVCTTNPLKEKRLDHNHFAVLCTTSDIRYYVGVVCLPSGEDRADLRNKKMAMFKRLIGGSPIVVGGKFNEDMTASNSCLIKDMRKTYNGADYSQSHPLAFSVNHMRTYLHYDLAKANKCDIIVEDGIFSTFPLVKEAFTDFRCIGRENPSDHAPIFQRFLVSIL